MSLSPKCNGLPLLDACIYEPVNGRWVATVQVDTDEALSDPITVDFEDGAVQLVGAIHRGDVESGRWLGTLVGGTGGLSNTLDPQAYYWAPLQLVLDDILSSAGETLASDATSLLDATRSHWQRAQGTGCEALQTLADELNYRWRVKRDGTVWLGADTYPELEADAVLVTAWPDQALRLYAPTAAPLVRPGVTYDGWLVDHVTTRLEGGTLRQDIWRAIT